jgi:hypothetical protein
MLRKMGQGFKRSRKSIIGIFKGARRRKREQEETEEEKFPFGVPEENVGVSYISAEGEIAELGDRRKSMVFTERESTVRTVRNLLTGRKEKKSTTIKGILKSTLLLTSLMQIRIRNRPLKQMGQANQFNRLRRL